MSQLTDPPVALRPSSPQPIPSIITSFDPPRRSLSLPSSPGSVPADRSNLARVATTLHPAPSRRLARSLINPADLVSKINLLDLATEITAIIFRYAHKPKDFHYLLPSGAGPLIHRKYNLPLTVSKEWYRRAQPIYYEDLRLTWLRIPNFVENIQRFERLTVYIQSVHIRISGKTFYKTIRRRDERVGFVAGSEEGARLSVAQLLLWVGQYLESPLATFAIVLDSLVCLKDLTLRFVECKGGEVSLQTIAAILTNLPEAVENLYLDCAAVTKQSPINPHPVHLCPIIRRHSQNLRKLFLSCRYLCQDLFHPDLIPNWQPPEDALLSPISLLADSPSYPNLEIFTIYREGRVDPTPRPCSEMYLHNYRTTAPNDDWAAQFLDYAVQACRRGAFPSIKRFEIPSNAYHPNGRPCSSVFDVLQDDNYWNSNEEIVIDEEGDEEVLDGNDLEVGEREWTLPQRWWRSRRIRAKVARQPSTA